MRAQRIKTGFHRIGVVGAGLCALPAALYLVFGAFLLASSDMDAGAAIFRGVLWLLGAGAAYAGARALGWIIAGFVGDQISN